MAKAADSFWGRQRELASLRDWNGQAPRLTALYGRRRVGKTRLVREAYTGSDLFEVEGLEGQSQREQQRLFIERIAVHFNRPELRTCRPADWLGVLSILSDVLGDRSCVVFLDEFQWLAGGRTKLVSHLKYAWDNLFSRENHVHVIVCGSVSSFIVNKVLKSKALYGRIERELHLRPLYLNELVGQYLPNRSLKELVEVYMILGGVPQYLRLIDPARSVRLNLADLCFTPNAYLVNEFERLFASHFGKNRHYRDILEQLASRGWASRKDLQEACHIDPGGRATEYLQNLVLAGFVEGYSPVDRPRAVRRIRYRIADPYLRFYFKFIRPKLGRIAEQVGDPRIAQFLPDQSYRPWRGLAFERVCHVHRQLIAEKLGFGAVQYESGAWFGYGAADRRTQIDLLYLRADNVITLCEMKFTETPPGVDLIDSVEDKVRILPNPKGRTIEKVLITATQPTTNLISEGYFDGILALQDLFG